MVHSVVWTAAVGCELIVQWALVSPDGVAPIRMVGVSASVNLPLHHKVQKFSSGIGSPAVKRLWLCVFVSVRLLMMIVEESKQPG